MKTRCIKSKYMITGTDRRGKRFSICTNTPQHYNIWRGTLLKVDKNKRKKIGEYNN